MSKQPKSNNWKDNKNQKNPDYLSKKKKKTKNEPDEEFDDSFLNDENLLPRKKQS
jgi:hypothetical protein